ncbi:MAG: hypothetical protein AMXMBFR56_07330 [Polyangiaceae bacterium]
MAAAGLPVVRERWLFGLAALGSFAVSLPRVCRELALMGDSAELVAAAHVWGVPRAPGYALWTLIGHAATKLPFGSEAFCVNLTSALFHAVAVGAVAVLGQRLARAAAGGVAAALCLTLAKSFLLGSLYAEVFPLNDALFALCLWCAVRASESEAARGWFLSLCALAGLGLAHHELYLLGLPALLVLVARPLRSALRARRVRALELGLALVVPFACCQLLLWIAAARAPIVSMNELAGAAGLWQVLTRADYGGLFGAARAASVEPAGERVGALALLLLESFGPLALALALVGTFRLLRERRSACVGLLLAVAVPGPCFAAAFRVAVEGEIPLAGFERWTTMVHPPLAVLAGVGMVTLYSLVPKQLPRRRVLSLFAALLPALPLVGRVGAVDLSGDRAGGYLARDFLRGLPEGSLVLVSGDFYSGVALYACAVERRCSAVRVVAPGLLAKPWRRAQHERRYPDVPLPEGRMVLARSHELVASQLPLRPVYVVPNLFARDAELEKRFRFRPEGLLARVYPDEDAAKADTARHLALASEMAAGRGCEGCTLDPASVYRPSPHVQVLMAYSAMLENVSRLALRAGALEPGNQLRTRFRALDAAVGAQITFSSAGNP